MGSLENLAGIGIGLGAIALVGGAVALVVKGLNELGDAMLDSNERHATERYARVPTTTEDRLDLLDELGGGTATQDGAAYVRVFDQNGDGRVAEQEWKLGAGRDAVYGNRLFALSDRGGVLDGGATPDEVARFLALFGPPTQTLDSDVVDLRRTFRHQGAVQDQDDLDESRTKHFFEPHGMNTKDSPSRPDVLALRVLDRYDADRDGVIDRDGEATHRSGSFVGDATALLARADTDDDRVVDKLEMLTYVRSLDTSTPGRDGPEGGANGYIEGGDLRGDPSIKLA